jgi:hypothetical protein
MTEPVKTVDARFSDPGAALVFSVKPTKILAFATGVFSQTRYQF